MRLNKQATGLKRGAGGGRCAVVLWALCVGLWGGACDRSLVEAGDGRDAVGLRDGDAEGETIADARPDGLASDGLASDGLASDALASDGLAGDGLAGDGLATPGFALGINSAGMHGPAAFTELHDGDDLVIELGGQGLWMVVAAFRTHGILTSPVTIEATLASGDTVLSELGLAGQALVGEADGFDYYYDLVVVVDPARLSGADRQAATLTVRVSDSGGQEEVAAVAVRLRGGPDAPSRAP